MTTMRVVGECFFWYRLTRVFPDKFHRAVKRLCVCVCAVALLKSTHLFQNYVTQGLTPLLIEDLVKQELSWTFRATLEESAFLAKRLFFLLCNI